MREKTQQILAGPAVVFLIGALLPMRSLCQDGAATTNTQQLPLQFLGTASCSSQGCHGGVASRRHTEIQHNEYTIWNRHDKHALAYETLLGESAQRIAANLARQGKESKRPNQDPRCLACHAIPEPGPDNLARASSQGVSCEACHGPAIKWLSPHTAGKGWQRNFKQQQPSPVDVLDPSEENMFGMTRLDDVDVLAKTCARCHVGASPVPAQGIPTREVNHDLIVAGHPPLRFELSAYLANLPPHWRRDLKSKEREPTFQSRVWLAGQLASAMAALELLEHRARQSFASDPDQRSPWPEFSEYDCYACHHDLAHPSWRQKRVAVGRTPGRMRWGSWYFSMPRVIVSASEPSLRNDSALNRLTLTMEDDLFNSLQAAEQANQAQQGFAEWRRPVFSEFAARFLDQLDSTPVNFDEQDWETNTQLVFALTSLHQVQQKLRIGQPPDDATNAIDKTLRDLAGKLAFPKGFDTPRDSGSPREVDAEMKALIRQLRSRR